eukprot:6614126-Ditylum_brightwellii.AAC.1
MDGKAFCKDRWLIPSDAIGSSSLEMLTIHSSQSISQSSSLSLQVDSPISDWDGSWLYILPTGKHRRDSPGCDVSETPVWRGIASSNQ